MQVIVSGQACASGVGDRTVVDPEAQVPYDMRTETAMAPSPLAGEGAPLNWRPSADAVAGNGWDGGEKRGEPVCQSHMES